MPATVLAGCAGVDRAPKGVTVDVVLRAPTADRYEMTLTVPEGIEERELVESLDSLVYAAIVACPGDPEPDLALALTIRGGAIAAAASLPAPGVPEKRCLADQLRGKPVAGAPTADWTTRLVLRRLEKGEDDPH